MSRWSLASSYQYPGRHARETRLLPKVLRRWARGSGNASRCRRACLTQPVPLALHDRRLGKQYRRSVSEKTCRRRLGRPVSTARSTGGVSKARRQPDRQGHAELPAEPAQCGRPSANALARMRRIWRARVWLRPPVGAARALARAATGTSPRQAPQRHSYQGWGSRERPRMSRLHITRREPSLTAEGSLAGSVLLRPFPLPLGMRLGRRPGTTSTWPTQREKAERRCALCMRTEDRSPHRGSQPFRPSADG